MKVLAVNGSVRKNGNTDILLKEALMACEAEGAEVGMIRLTEYEIKPCNGCGLCLFNKDKCRNEGDGVEHIFAAIDEADAILLGTPCYFLEATAVVKQLIDRCWIRGHKTDKVAKPASVIIPYATQGWIPLAMFQPNMLLHQLGMRKINQLTVNVQGISEALLDQEAMEQAYNLGKELIDAARSGDYAYRGEEGLCPLCHDNVLRVFNDNRSVECPLCGIRGDLQIVDGRIEVRFDEQDFARSRLSRENIYNHFTYHIKPSKEYFLKTKEERKLKGAKYREYLNS